jgi:hypothetical protein
MMQFSVASVTHTSNTPHTHTHTHTLHTCQPAWPCTYLLCPGWPHVDRAETAHISLAAHHTRPKTPPYMTKNKHGQKSCSLTSHADWQRLKHTGRTTGYEGALTLLLVLVKTWACLMPDETGPAAAGTELLLWGWHHLQQHRCCCCRCCFCRGVWGQLPWEQHRCRQRANRRQMLCINIS